MRDVREYNAQTGEAMRWFVYTLALLLPWISLIIEGPWLAVATACGGLGFWLWWVHPPLGCNRRPITWIFTFLLICGSATVVLLAADQLQHPDTDQGLLTIRKG